MPTAKQRFLALPEAKEFFDLSAGNTIQTALEYALLDMVETEQYGPDERAAMRAGLRIDGARQFVKCLLSLPVATETKPAKPYRPPNLEP